MIKTFKKRGQKLSKRLSRFSERTSEVSRKHLKTNFFDRIHRIHKVRLLILEWSLLITVLILLAITQAFWYTNADSTTGYVPGGSYTEATSGKINSLNPLFAATSSEKTLSKLMFASLATTDYSGHIGCSLARSINADPEGKIWTVTLRDDLKWSDGQPLSIDDVLFTVQLIQTPGVNTAYASNLSKVQVSKAETANTLIFTLPSPYVGFASALTFPILPEHALKDVKLSQLLEHEFSTTKPITSGPFSFNAMQSIGNSGEAVAYLEANRNYHLQRPLLNTFALHAFTDRTDIIKALNAGTVTATAELLPTDAPNISAKDIYEKQTALHSGVFAFLNHSSPILRQSTLRQAIQKGIDLDKLRSITGSEAALDYPLLASQTTLKDFPGLPQHDLKTAREMVTAAGLPADQMLQIATIDTGYLPQLARKLAAQLRLLGFKTNLSIYDASEDFLVNVIRPRAYDILLYEVELGANPDLFAYYHSSQATSTGLNLSNYRSSTADDLIISARSSMDASTRAAKHQAFLQQWLADVPAIGIYQSNLSYYFNKNIRSFSEDNRLVFPTDRFADLSYWAVTRSSVHRTP